MLWGFRTSPESPAVSYKGESKQFAPEEVSSMVLVKMREVRGACLRLLRLLGGACLYASWEYLLLGKSEHTPAGCCRENMLLPGKHKH